jgi:hypothetical protein
MSIVQCGTIPTTRSFYKDAADTGCANHDGMRYFDETDMQD